MSRSAERRGARALALAGACLAAAGALAQTRAEPEANASGAEASEAGASHALAALGTGDAGRTGYGLGRAALPEEVAAWDIDVRPDGQGLPPGSGDVGAGEEVYLDYCASCHGDFGEGIGRWPVLMGGFGTLAGHDPVKTVGSYWPYLSTVWDYVHRAMPFGSAQILTDDEVYAVTAYLLYLNDLVEDDFVLSQETFLEVEMPNEGAFRPDDRSETELLVFSEEPCMTACAEGIAVTRRAAVLDVTPEEAGEGGTD